MCAQHYIYYCVDALDHLPPNWTVYTQFDYAGMKAGALELPLHSAHTGVVYYNIDFDDAWFSFFNMPHCDCRPPPILLISKQKKSGPDGFVSQKMACYGG